MKSRKARSNGVAAKRMPKWKRHLDEYCARDIVRITFPTVGDIDAGIGLIWGGKLTGVPFDLDPTSDSFFVPKAALPYFAAAGIKFTHKPAFEESH